MGCYESLSQTVYYEPTIQVGDIAKKRAGHILPTATPDELKEAKCSWKKVLDLKSYIIFRFWREELSMPKIPTLINKVAVVFADTLNKKVEQMVIN